MNIDMNALTVFFGWMSVINFSLLIVGLFLMATCQKCIMNIHKKIFHVTEEHLPEIYMNHLGRYKVLTLAFSLAPYIALKIMAS